MNHLIAEYSPLEVITVGKTAMPLVWDARAEQVFAEAEAIIDEREPAVKAQELKRAKLATKKKEIHQLEAAIGPAEQREREFQPVYTGLYNILHKDGYTPPYHGPHAYALRCFKNGHTGINTSKLRPHKLLRWATVSKIEMAFTNALEAAIAEGKSPPSQSSDEIREQLGPLRREAQQLEQDIAEPRGNISIGYKLFGAGEDYRSPTSQPLVQYDRGIIGALIELPFADNFKAYLLEWASGVGIPQTQESIDEIRRGIEESRRQISTAILMAHPELASQSAIPLPKPPSIRASFFTRNF